MGEFAANANVSAITKIPPFLATNRYNPKMSFDYVDLSANSTCKKIANATARSIAGRMKEVWNFICTEIARSQETQATTAN